MRLELGGIEQLAGLDLAEPGLDPRQHCRAWHDRHRQRHRCRHLRLCAFDARPVAAIDERRAIVPLGVGQHAATEVERPEGADLAAEVAGHDTVEALAIILVQVGVFRPVVDGIAGVMAALLLLAEVEPDQPDVAEAHRRDAGKRSIAAQRIDERQDADALRQHACRAETATDEEPRLREQRGDAGIDRRRRDEGDAGEAVLVVNLGQQLMDQRTALDFAVQVGPDAVLEKNADRGAAGDEDRPVAHRLQVGQVAIERRPGADDQDGKALLAHRHALDDPEIPALQVGVAVADHFDLVLEISAGDVVGLQALLHQHHRLPEGPRRVVLKEVRAVEEDVAVHRDQALDLEADVLRMLVEDEVQLDVAPVGAGDHPPPVDGVQRMPQELLDRLDEDEVAGRRLLEQLGDVMA